MSEQVSAKGGRGGKKGVRKAPANPMNLWMVNKGHCEDGWWPEIRPTQAIPEKLVTFMVADAHRHHDAFAHFFIDDYRFERLWSDPDGYLPVLRQYAGVIGPDYSTYRDMPKPMQMWNAYRTRALESYWQQQGIEVIPNIQFSQEDTWGWAVRGMPKHSVLAASVVGNHRDPIARDILVRGMENVVAKLEPTLLVMYGKPIAFDSGDVPQIWYHNDNDRRMTEARNAKRNR